MSLILFKVTIPGRTRIKKNGKQISINRKTGRMFLRSSDQYLAWAKMVYLYIKQERITSTINFPVNLCCRFYFENHQHEPDLSNCYQGIEDILQEANVLKNDSLVYSHDGSGKFFGEEPRIEIEITAKA